MSPWKIIGWIILALMVLSLTFCGLVCVRVASNSAPSPSAAASSVEAKASKANEPVYHADVLSIGCDKSYNKTRVSVTIRNTGGNEIPYAKAFFRVGSESVDTYFSPSTIPSGSMASADIRANTLASCQLVAIQDGQGHEVMITAPPGR